MSVQFVKNFFYTVQLQILQFKDIQYTIMHLCKSTAIEGLMTLHSHVTIDHSLSLNTSESNTRLARLMILYVNWSSHYEVTAWIIQSVSN